MVRIEERKSPVWEEDLIMCPSQCYCYFESDGKRYCIYLRWRWDDPWVARVVPVDNKCDFTYNGDWELLETKCYSHDAYKKLESEAVRVIMKRFTRIKWLSQEYEE